jgi:hypothetical protein
LRARESATYGCLTHICRRASRATLKGEGALKIATEIIALITLSVASK